MQKEIMFNDVEITVENVDSYIVNIAQDAHAENSFEVFDAAVKIANVNDANNIKDVIKLNNDYIIGEYIYNGLDVNLIVDEEKCTRIIHFATIHKCGNVSYALIENGADINAQDDDGNTPLIFTAMLGLTGLSKTYITGLAKLDMQNNDGKTAFHVAADFKNKHTAIFLLNEGADIRTTDNEGNSSYTAFKGL